MVHGVLVRCGPAIEAMQAHECSALRDAVCVTGADFDVRCIGDVDSGQGDGRFSGATRGAAIGHVSPEAANKGPIAAVNDGDIIKIDIPNCKLEVELSDKELSERLARLAEFEPKVKTGYLRLYLEKVSSASTGAVFNL